MAAIPVLFIWMCLINGGRVIGTKNLKELRSAVTVCNHVHKRDAALVAVALYPRKPFFSIAPEKVDPLFPGIFMSLLSCISVPRSLSEMNPFFKELETLLAEGRIVHFFPEGIINPYGTEIHDFKKGAFHLAAQARVPVLPITISFHEPRGLYKFCRKKPVMWLTIGELVSPISPDVKEDELVRMKSVLEQMEGMLQDEYCPMN